MGSEQRWSYLFGPSSFVPMFADLIELPEKFVKNCEVSRKIAFIELTSKH